MGHDELAAGVPGDRGQEVLDRSARQAPLDGVGPVADRPDLEDLGELVAELGIASAQLVDEVHPGAQVVDRPGVQHSEHPLAVEGVDPRLAAMAEQGARGHPERRQHRP
ncbi:MAG: hypothetical protein ACFCVK_01720 [Acidimicrobiales bacterium]